MSETCVQGSCWKTVSPICKDCLEDKIRVVVGEELTKRLRRETPTEAERLLLSLCELVDKYGLEYGIKMEVELPEVAEWWEKHKPCEPT